MAEICGMKRSRKRKESSSSEAAPAGTRNYDVFLNHRGPDVKKSFADHLAAALKSAGVPFFIDHKDLHEGYSVWDTIESAIRRSKIHIAIFSPDYASSPWCLKELQEMLACCANGCSQLFLPVFFHVNPSDLRHSQSLNSCYFEALEKHKQSGHYGQEVIANWRSALNKASEVKGFTLDTAQGFEAVLVKLIVSKVLDVLNHTSLDIARHPVGVKEKLQEVLAIDKAHHGLHILGIYGMGGVGKTTLAKSIYNEIYRDFDGVCYIENVRTEAKTDGLKSIQKRMLVDLLKATIDVSSISQGKQVMKERLPGLKILIILDDIDDREQVKALIEPFETINLKEGSQLVVTTRDEQIVIWAKAQQRFPMDGLSEAQAHTLFNWHAFLNPEGPPKLVLRTLAEKVVDACQGLPLALETLGAHLYGKNIEVWKATVKVLQGPRHNPAQRDVMSILRVSYDGLGNEERVMFLDIACFLLGEREDRAKRILCCESDAAELCLETLRLKSLVKLDGDRRLTMHDLLRDMGREIVEGSHKNDVWRRSHLWDETEVRKVLQKRKDASDVRGVRFTLEAQERWSAECFAGMDSLKFLFLRSIYPDDWCLEREEAGKIVGDFGLFPTELTWFEWLWCPLESLPHELDLNKVAVLDLSDSNIASLSNGHTFENLRKLSLKRATNIRKLPDFSVSCKKLEVLDLSMCYNLESVPESIGCLSSTLTRLDLTSGLKLTTLPDALVHLNSLKSLKLDGCSSLTMLLDVIGQLTALEDLGLKWLSQLKLLPRSVGNLTKLSSLDLPMSNSLKELPCTIGNLRQLSSLFVSSSRLVTLPEEIGKLSKLVTLGLSGNLILSHLPRSIGQLKELVNLSICNISLEHLDLFMNPFSKMPVHLHLLSKLRTLRLIGCEKLREIPPLPPSLEKLDTSGCHLLTRLPSMSYLSALRTLRLSKCKYLREIPPLPPALEELDTSGCHLLTGLPSMSCLRALRKLDLEACEGLQKLIGLDSLSHLEECNAQGCKGLRIEMSQLASLTSLRELSLPHASQYNWMEKLVSLESVAVFDDGEHLPHYFNEYKQEVQEDLERCAEWLRDEMYPDVLEEEDSIHVVQVRVPRTGDGKECKGLVICIACPGVILYVKIGPHLVCVEEVYIESVHVWIYRATKHPFVADLKGGATLELLILSGREPEVAVRLVYKDHGFE